MDSIKEMMQDMEAKYYMILKEDEEIDDVCKRLRKEYDILESSDEEGMLKQLVFNIIIASMIVKEEAYIVEYYGMKIRKMLREYEENEEKLCLYCSDNDMKLIEGMIAQINTCKDKMYPVKQMITDIEEDYYYSLLKENRDIEYIFIRFWEDYSTYANRNNKRLMLQSLVFDIIIASMNIKEETSIVASFGMQIRRMMREYEENKEKLPIYYDDKDMKLIEDMIDQINACKEKWVK